MKNRYTVPAKKINKTNSKLLEIVIFAAGASERMGRLGDKQLIVLPNGKTLLNHQIEILSKLYNPCDIFVVVGHNHQKIIDSVNHNVRFVINEKYNETNITHSMYLTGSLLKSKSLLVVYGDIYFDHLLYKEIRNVINEQSTIFTSQTGMHKETVCVRRNKNDNLSYICYDLKDCPSWSNMIYVLDDDWEIMQNLCIEPKQHNKLFFEIINGMVDLGCKIQSVELPGIKEIDESKDFKKL